jgi:hypothetical protein
MRDVEHLLATVRTTKLVDFVAVAHMSWSRTCMVLARDETGWTDRTRISRHILVNLRT